MKTPVLHGKSALAKEIFAMTLTRHAASCANRVDTLVDAGGDLLLAIAAYKPDSANFRAAVEAMRAALRSAEN